VYFTDPESIFVCKEASEFGQRLELGYSTSEGCAIVFFNTDGLSVEVPKNSESPAKDGLTSGGAREWVIRGNCAIDLVPGAMEAFEVHESGFRYGPVGQER
jgi:hypothetical protein